MKRRLTKNKLSIFIALVIAFVFLMSACSNNVENDKVSIPSEEDTSANEIEESAVVSEETFENGEGNESLEVHFIDVGQGDAILVVCANDTMLIDGGNSGASDLIYTYLKQHEIDHLKYIICTHPDEDHVGGLAGALNYAIAETAYCSESENESEAFNDFLKYLSIQNVPLEVPKPGTTLVLGTAKGEIIGPVNNAVGTNNNSLVIKLEYGNTTFLFTGDAESAEEEDLIRTADLKSTVLKIGHHGGNNSTSDAFLDAVEPEYAIISCGEYNSYGHPADGVLKRLREHQVQLFRTDMQGDIICRTDGEDIEFFVEKSPEADTFLTYYDLYGTGESSDTEIERSIPEISDSTDNTQMEYILNVKSKKFHKPDCDSVKKMKEENKIYYFGTRDEIIAEGYEPCGNCHP